MNSFRNRLLALIIGLVVATQSVTLVAVLWSTAHQVQVQADEELRSGAKVVRVEASESKEVPRAVGSFVKAYLSAFPEAAFDPGLYMRETAKLDNRSAEVVSRQLDEVETIATSLVQRGIGSGEFRAVKVEEAADCLIGMLNHVIFQKIHFSKSLDIEKKGEAITSFFLNAMRP